MIVEFWSWKDAEGHFKNDETFVQTCDFDYLFDNWDGKWEVRAIRLEGTVVVVYRARKER